MRFPILMSPLWRPLLLPFGGTTQRSYVELEDGVLHVRFGWLFDHRFPLDQVEAASPSHWPLLGGIGWRTNFRGTVGLIGTYVNVVEIRFKERQRLRMLLPTSCERIYISLQEPHDFIAALGEATAAVATAEPVAAGVTTAPKRRRKKSG
ncbi:MAG: hypothetical protein IIC87_04330 [Chloroflexi bacterium]|nr:hypothetical protein [Chloroflexota bacterium]